MAEAPRLKPQKVVEILDSSFRLYRDNFVTFLGILAGAYVPIILLNVIMTGMMFAQVGTMTTHQGEQPDAQKIAAAMGPVMAVAVITGLLSAIALSLATGALTRAVGLRYLNQPAGFGACWKHILGMFGKFLGTNLLVGLVVFLGLFTIVGWIFFIIWFIFTSSIVVLEGLGGTAALGRSKALGKGSRWRIVGMGILLFLIQVVLQAGIGAVEGMVIPKLSSSAATVAILNTAVTQVLGMIVAPFMSVAWVLLYYDVRIRNEAFDLEVLAKAMAQHQAKLDQAAPPPLP